MTRPRQMMFVALAAALPTTAVRAQTLLDRPDVAYRDVAREPAAEPAPVVRPAARDNPYRGIAEHYPEPLDETEVCRQALAGFAAQRVETVRAVDEGERGLRDVDREFVDTCQPSRLKPSEREGCLMAFRLKRDHLRDDLGRRRETLARLDDAALHERRRCAAVPRPASERSGVDLKAVAVESDAALPGGLEIEWLQANWRVLGSCRELEPVVAARLIGRAKDVAAVLDAAAGSSGLR